MKILMALMATVLTVGVCQADITYDVNLTVGAATVTGTIVTDGNFGVLGTIDIVSYSLTFKGGFEPGTDPANGTDLVNIKGNALTATATQLLFNFSAPVTPPQGSYVYLSDSTNSGPRLVVCAVSFLCTNSGLSDGGLEFTPETGTQVIATAEVTVASPSAPEASSLVPLGIGVLALAGLRGRKRLIDSRKK